MSRLTRLVLACALTAGTGCTAEPTRPHSAQLAPTVPERSMDPNRLDDGTCRSGYQVANGKCTAI